MRSLFWRIFLWFWLTFAAMALVWFVLAATIEWEPSPFPRLPRGSLMARFQGRTAVNLYELGGKEPLRRYLDSVEERLGSSLFLLNDEGEDVLGRPVPDSLLPDFESRGNPDLSTQELSEPGAGDTLEAQGYWSYRIRGESGSAYRVIMPRVEPGARPRRSRGLLLFGMLSRPGVAIRLGLVVLTAGLLCYLLARRLTRPLAKLQEATRSLAAGDLSVRVSPRLGSRSDEISELARAFDAMAGRVQDLVGAQRQLMRDVSHELRSPLARLSIALNLVGKSRGSDMQKNLDRARVEIERIDSLITQVLELSRLESGTLEEEEDVFDLSAILEEVVADSAYEAEHRGIRVETGQLESCRVRGSRRSFQSALENVVRNAVRYTEGGSGVEIGLQRSGGEKGQIGIVSVRDHGPGVPEASLEAIFGPFQRVGGARDRESGGTGLGLSIAQRIVLAHGGEIDASNHPEGGLVVRVALPLVSEAEPPVGSRGDSSICRR